MYCFPRGGGGGKRRSERVRDRIQNRVESPAVCLSGSRQPVCSYRKSCCNSRREHPHKTKAPAVPIRVPCSVAFPFVRCCLRIPVPVLVCAVAAVAVFLAAIVSRLSLSLSLSPSLSLSFPSPSSLLLSSSLSSSSSSLSPLPSLLPHVLSVHVTVHQSSHHHHHHPCLVSPQHNTACKHHPP